MAKCKLCKTNIPDGIEYCKDCLDKKNTNETYLDSLLNSVKNTVPSAENSYKKKSNTTIISKPMINEELKLEDDDIYHIDDDDMYHVDLSDIEDFDQFNFNDDLGDINNDIVIGDEELFGEKLSNMFIESNKNIDDDQLIDNNIDNNTSGSIDSITYSNTNTISNTDSNIESNTDSNTENNNNSNIQSNSNTIINSSTNNINDSNTDIDTDGNFNFEDEKIDFDKEIAELLNTSENQELSNNQELSKNILTDELDTTEHNDNSPEENLTNNNFNQNEIFDYQDDDSMDLDLNDLLNSIEFSANDDDLIKNHMPQKEEPLSTEAGIEPLYSDDFEQIEAEDDDFLSLLNQISSDDPVSADVNAIKELLNGESATTKNKSNAPSNVGDVFSDALKVVSSLNDYDEEAILDQITSSNGKKDKSSKKGKGKRKNNSEEEQDVSSKAEKSKKGLFKRLFANINEVDADGNPIKKKGSKNEVGASEKKISKKKSGKKAKESVSNADGNEDSLDDKEPVKGKKVSKKSNKKDDREKKKKTKEIIQVIDEIEEDEGRINRLGATIVFIFFGLLVMVLLVGINVVSYSLNIQNATNYFNKQKYTQAYNEVYGIEIKDEDIEIYDKIMTVMFVNKQLNSYNNYYRLEQYPEALDSLLKGLKRYDKYIELATILEIKTDLDYVRNQILAELKNVFQLSEKEAVKIADYNSMEEYSLVIYNVAIEKMNK